MDIKSVLMDIVKHTSGLGIIDNVKVTGTDGKTTIAAMDSDKTVILTAKMHDTVP
jgi:UDP-N-acetylmuramate-alanine ligase